VGGKRIVKKPNLVRTLILTGSFLLQLSPLCFHSRGAAGDVDLSFDPGSGVNGFVRAVVLQPDGKVVIGGEFTTVKGLARSKVARLNADGSGDSSFHSAAGILGYITSVALQADGKVLVGHSSGISRLNSDGSLDSTFNPGTKLLGYVASVTCQPDGKLLVGYNSDNSRIYRLNSDGSQDTNFIASLGCVFKDDGCGVGVSSIAVQSDGKVLIAGYFYTENGTNVNHGIARLNSNGSLDSSFNPGTGAFIVCNSVVLQPDGKVLIGGGFSTVNGQNRNGIARLNANGSLDSSFDPGTGANGSVLSVALQSNGKVLIGGDFSIARLNSNGSTDGTFNPGAGVSGRYVFSIALQPDGKILIGGSLESGSALGRIARLNGDGSLDGSFNTGAGVNNLVVSLIAQPDGKVLLGGNFTTVKDLARSGMARLNSDGSGDSSFNAPFPVFSYGGLHPMALQPDGKVLLGLIAARLNANGSRDNSFQPDLTGIYNTNCTPGYDCYYGVVANAIAVQPDGKLLLGGYSTHIECDQNEGACLTAFNYFVIRLNSNGSRDTGFELAIGTPTFGGGESVQSLALQPDGKVVVAGLFNSIKGTNRNGIARLNANGSLDTTFNAGTGANGNIRSIAVQPDGKVLIGGSYFVLNGTNYIYGIARLNANGSLDSTFNPGAGVGISGLVGSLALRSDAKVLIGGSFTTVNGTNRHNIARLNGDGSLDSSFNPGAGADGIVRSIALQSDGNVFIGGDFTTVNGVVRPYVARLHGDSAAPSLNIARSNAFVIVSWPVTSLNFQLQENTNLSLPNFWTPVTQSAVTNAGQISVNVPTTAARQFFRLKSQ
jgi:uncharacterized delta-60 repeat protein